MSSSSSGRIRMSHHQLSSGMMVSGPPEQPKDRSLSAGSRAMPYTGGDVRKSGELGKMLNINAAAASSSPAAGSRSHSGPFPHSPSAVSSSRKSSGALSHIQPTGLITSGPVRSQAEMAPPTPAKKRVYGAGVTVLTREDGYGFRIPRMGVVACVIAFGLGLGAGVLVLVVVRKWVILVVVGGMLVVVGVSMVWNWAWRRRGVEGFWRDYPASSVGAGELPVGKLVKVAGVVTCGSNPLEASYQKVPRCVYTSTELYEYRGWNDEQANPTHKLFHWGLRYSERHVADFYISDRVSGTRFLVRAGNGAKITCLVRNAYVVDMNKGNKEQSPIYTSWLAEHNIPSDDRVMRLKEGYIKEGDDASVIGILRKQDNLLIIDTLEEPVSTGCQWRRCLIPMYMEGIVLLGDKSSDMPDYLV